VADPANYTLFYVYSNRGEMDLGTTFFYMLELMPDDKEVSEGPDTQERHMEL
jgi:hypothetical protein